MKTAGQHKPSNTPTKSLFTVPVAQFPVRGALLGSQDEVFSCDYLVIELSDSHVSCVSGFPVFCWAAFCEF